MKLKLPRHAGWFALGLFTFALIAADVTTTMFDPAIFHVTDSIVTVTNTLKQASTNTFTGAGRMVLETEVPALQTNVNAANPTATIGATAVNGSAGTFMRSDAAPALSSNLGNVNTGGGNAANWSASGTTNSSLAGLATVNGLTATQTVTAADMRFTGTTTSGLRLKSLTTAQKNALTSAAGDMVFDSDLGRFQAYDGAAWHSRVRLDGDTMTGVLTGPGFDYTAPATLTPTDAGVSIDFGAANRLATCTLTGAVTFAFANQTAGRRYELFIMGCSTNSPITWPTVSGVFPAGAYPSVAAAGKWHHLKFTCISSTSTTNIYIDGSTSN